MQDLALQKATAFSRAWFTVFLATIVSGVLACSSLLVTSHVVRLNGPAFSTTTPLSQVIWQAALLGAYVAAPVGAVSATICAPLLMRRPRRTAFWSIVLVSVIVGPLTAPIIHLFSAILVLIAQVLTSVIVFATCEPDPARVPDDLCSNCRYSLTGLDRSKTRVCPECGEPIRSRA